MTQDENRIEVHQAYVKLSYQNIAIIFIFVVTTVGSTVGLWYSMGGKIDRLSDRQDALSKRQDEFDQRMWDERGGAVPIPHGSD